MEVIKMRIYGKTLNTWTSIDEKGREVITQREIEYSEYNDGVLVATGSEDFSPERYRQEISEKWVWSWDGVKLNRGGHRAFEGMGRVKFRKSEKKEVIQYFKNKYQSALVQLR